ncbi:MAG: hypothetical protein FWF11_00745 [Coriobacteriia bacterium]|nr:hypothetical protein [Coriobacteriia bacterium]
MPPTTENLPVARLFEHYPDLHRHRCESGRPRSFKTEAQQTESVHLLEHLAVELLAQSGVARDCARGQTGIPRSQQADDSSYRLNFYGADSLQQMDLLLRRAADIFEHLLLM